MPSNDAVVRRLYDQIWSLGNLDVVDQICSHNMICHESNRADDIVGSQAFKHFVTIYRNAFPNLKTTVEDVVVARDKVVARWSARGTHEGELMGVAPTHREVTFRGVDIYRFYQGRIQEQWINYNALSALQQIGAVPALPEQTKHAGG